MPRVLLALAGLLAGYTVYAFAVVVEKVYDDTSNFPLLIWASFVSALILLLARLLLKLARERLAVQRARRDRSALFDRTLHRLLFAWTPMAMFLVGYGVGGVDVGLITGFGGVIAGAVLAPAVPPGFLSSRTATVQGVRVSVGIAVFFFPLFVTAFFLTARTHGGIAVTLLLTAAPIVFRLLDLLTQHVMRRHERGSRD